MQTAIKRTLIAAAIALAGTASAHAADVTISGLSATAGVTNALLAADGAFPANGQQWQTQTAWWYGTDQSVLFTFDKVYSVTGFTVSLDNNDSYAVQLSSDGMNWGSTVAISSAEGSVGWGMDTFDRSLSPTLAKYARVSATGGDNMYSVGELRLTAAVPEPETYAMLMTGLGLLGLMARRKKTGA